jgi:hypothetical protein
MILPITYNLLASGANQIDAGMQLVVDKVLSTICIDGTYSIAEALRVCMAVLAGKTGISGSTVTFRNTTDTVTRVTATMSGRERTSVTIDAS